MKLTLTSLSLVDMWPSSPAPQLLARLPLLGYTAQMVTPAPLFTTSILTDAGSDFRPFLTAVTTTSDPEPAVARTSPLTPLISMLLPAATVPFQSQVASCAAGRGRARAGEHGEPCCDVPMHAVVPP